MGTLIGTLLNSEWIKSAAIGSASKLRRHIARRLVLDCAGWHSTKMLQVPKNITLVPLPVYSPELNPVERVWHFLEHRFSALRLFDNHKATVGDVESLEPLVAVRQDVSRRSQNTHGSCGSSLKLAGDFRAAGAGRPTVRRLLRIA